MLGEPFFFLNSTVVNAAREGARNGVVVVTDSDDAIDTAESVATSYLAAAGISAGGCVNCATVTASYADPNLSVTVTIDYTPLTGFLPASAFPTQATHTSTMRAEGFLP